MTDTYPADIDQCPFCGAEVAHDNPIMRVFDCGTCLNVTCLNVARDEDGCDYYDRAELSQECHETVITAKDAEIAELKARIEDLEGVVNKLPVTADGVPVIPGVDWIWGACFFSGRATCFPISSIDTDECTEFAFFKGVQNHYSSREAFDAAQAAKEGDEGAGDA